MGAIPKFVDNTYGTLGSGIGVTDTTIALTAGHGVRFPAVASGQVLHATLVNSSNVLEQIHITAHTSNADSLTVTRGENGTTAKAWSAGDRIECRLTSEFLNELAAIAVSAKYWAVGDGVTDDSAALVAGADALDALGGGILYAPPGTYATATGVTFGNGSNSAVSTKHNKVVLAGAGMGSSTGVTNQEVHGATRILYTGSASASAAVVTFAGPMYGIGLKNVELDCNSLAGIGVLVNHVTQGSFARASVRNPTSIGWSLTTRTGFPTGCAFGCAKNRFDECFSFIDDGSIGVGTVLGISLTSGVNSALSLSGNPDSAGNVFIGGTFFYGQSSTSYGIYLNGADNNVFIECELLPYGLSTSGNDVWFQQWAGSGQFPLENHFINVPTPNGIGGNSGVGSANGNTFFPLPTSDGGGGIPATPTCVSGGDHLGRSIVQGVQAYRGRQISQAQSQSTQTTTSASYGDITGYSVTLNNCLVGSQFLVEYQINALQAASGTGNFVIEVDSTAYGPTVSSIGATGFDATVTGKLVLSGLTAGSHTFKVQFKSDGTHTLSALNGTLTVQELY